MWFWGTDSSVPPEVRAQLFLVGAANTSAGLGLCKDEWAVPDPGMPPYWPHQLYVREAYRLVGDWVFTEHAPPPDIAVRS